VALQLQLLQFLTVQVSHLHQVLQLQLDSTSLETQRTTLTYQSTA